MATETVSTSRIRFLQSPEVREISANLTVEETVELKRMFEKFVWWYGFLFVSPLACALTRRDMYISVMMVIISGYAVSLLAGYLKSLREFYCSTAYARERGFTPEILRLFRSFGRRERDTGKNSSAA